MTITKTREIIERIKDELRQQASSWNYNLIRDRGMNLALQRKVERAIEKSKIVQKVRLKHAERLLNDIEFGNVFRNDLECEFQTYWSVILPEIKEVLLSFQEINRIKKIEDRIDKLEVPEKLDVGRDLPLESDIDVKSQVLEAAQSRTESGILRSVPGSLAQNKKIPRRGVSRTRSNR